jgi:hypothetical protein
VNYPSETTEGVLRGSAAMEKLVFYDDSPAARLHDVGLIKRIVLWPVKPTEEEMEYAWEFMRTAVGVYDLLKKENEICGADLTHRSVNGHIKDELAIAGIVVDYINSTGRINRSESGIRMSRISPGFRICTRLESDQFHQCWLPGLSITRL